MCLFNASTIGSFGCFSPVSVPIRLTRYTISISDFTVLRKNEFDSTELEHNLSDCAPALLSAVKFSYVGTVI